jgi:hypothetical protein
MMAKSPADRYQSPSELIEDLEHTALTQTGVSMDVLAALAEEHAHEASPEAMTRTDLDSEVEYEQRPATKKKATTEDERRASGSESTTRTAEPPPGPKPRKNRPRAGALPPQQEEGGFDWDVLKYLAAALLVAGLVVGGWVLSTRLAATFTDPAMVTREPSADDTAGIVRRSPREKAKPAANLQETAEEGTEPPTPESTSSQASTIHSAIGRPGEHEYFPAWVAGLPAADQPEQLEAARGLPTLSVGRGGSGQFSDLSTALERAPSSGAIVRLEGDGPFFLEPLQLGGGTVVIVGGNKRPLVCCSGPSTGAGQAVIAKTGGSLTLIGLDFVADASMFPSSGDFRFAELTSADLSVRNCSLTFRGERLGPNTAFVVQGTDPSTRARILIDHTVVRGSGLTSLAIDAPAFDFVAVNGLFVCGAAPFLSVNGSSVSAHAGDGSQAARDVRLLSCTVSSGGPAFDLSSSHASGSVPATELLAVNTLLCAAAVGAEPALLALGDWPAAAGEGASARRAPTNLRFATRSAAFLGWRSLVDWQTAPVTTLDDWAQTWDQPAEEVALSAQFWPGDLGDVGNASLDQFDAARLPGIDLQATDGGRLGCAANELSAPAPAVLARAAALRARPARFEDIPEGPAVEVDVTREDLGRLINKNDWESGTTFVITGTGAQQTSAIAVTGKDLRLRFTATPDAPLSLSPKAVLGEAPMISISGGAIEIENGVFKINATKAPSIPRWFLQVSDGSFSLENCYVQGPMSTSPHFSGLIDWTSSASASAGNYAAFGQIENSYLASVDSGVHAELAGRALLIQNSLIVSLTDLFAIQAGIGPAPGALDIRKSTLSAARSFFKIERAAGGSASPALVRCFVDESVCVPPLAGGTDDGPVLMALLPAEGSPPVVDWWEKRNGYAVEITRYLESATASASGSPQSFAGAWIRQWGADRVNQSLAARGDVMLDGPLPEPSQLEPKHFRLHAVSKTSSWAEGGGAIGADVDLLQSRKPVFEAPRREDSKKSKGRSGSKARF